MGWDEMTQSVSQSLAHGHMALGTECGLYGRDRHGEAKLSRVTPPVR
jgi:hypothetical protein